MLIILEGPDGSGKTTLARTLEERVRESDPDAKIEVWHRGAPKRHALNEYAVPLFDYRPGRRHHIICDRWHLGELVYSTVRRGGRTTLTPAVDLWLEMFLRSRGAYVVGTDQLIPADYAEVFRRRGDADRLMQLDELDAVRDAYELHADRVDQMIYTPRHVELGDASIQRLWCMTVSEIIQWAADIELRAADLNDLVTYVGPPTVDVLLVGDVRNNRTDVCEDPNRPAFVPYPPTSGDYLATALTIVQHAWRDERRRIGIVNANDVDDVRAAWERVGQPEHVVALGTYAHKTLQRVNIPHGMVPHPQYARRFHHDRVGRYAATLIGAALRRERITSWPASSDARTHAKVTTTSFEPFERRATSRPRAA